VVDDLWWEIFGSAACCLSAIAGVDGPTEVSEFDVVVVIEKDVFGLDVAVEDVVLMEVQERLSELGDVASRHAGREFLDAVEFGEEHSVGASLKNEVEAVVVEEVAVSAEDVLVTAVEGDLDLAAELNSDVEVGHILNIEALECDDEVCSLDCGERNTTVLTAAEIVEFFKIIKAPLRFGSRRNNNQSFVN
jgi:hypothetical protein